MKLFSFLKNRKSLLLMAAAVLLSHLSMAQDAATTAAPTAAAPAEATQSLMQIFLILIVAVLGIVVWGMGQVIVLLSKQLVEKQKNKKSSSVVTAILVLLGLSLLSSSTFAQGATTAASDTSMDLGGVSGMALYTFIAAIIVEIFAIFYLGGVIRNLHRNLFDIKPEAVKESDSLVPNWWHDLDKKVFTKS